MRVGKDNNPVCRQGRPLVSIVLPCRNEAAGIKQCLDSVLAQEAPEGGFEILVADGMSTDGTREILAGLEQEGGGRRSPGAGQIVRVIENRGEIVSTGLNAAIREAKGDIIIRMDAHTVFAPDYVRECVAQLQKTGADNVGGPARTKTATHIEQAIAAAYHSPFSVGGARFHDPGYEGFVDTVPYGCWWKETFARFGLFDEDLVRDQDDEHNLRIIRGGGKIWQSPKIKSWYRPRGAVRELFQQYMQYGYWKVRVIQKHKFPASWRHLVPAAFVLIWLGLLAFSIFCLALLLVSATFGPVVGSPGSVVHSATHFYWLPSMCTLVLISLTYLMAVVVASVLAAAHAAWKLLPLLPVVFGCYHLSYGFGFLCGAWDFVILRRTAKAKYKLLTR